MIEYYCYLKKTALIFHLNRATFYVIIFGKLRQSKFYKLNRKGRVNHNVEGKVQNWCGVN
jgi:hypothetical protein